MHIHILIVFFSECCCYSCNLGTACWCDSCSTDTNKFRYVEIIVTYVTQNVVPSSLSFVFIERQKIVMLLLPFGLHY